MTKRELALAKARSAGYHNDTRAYTRLIIESRVGREYMNRAWMAGWRQRQAGVRCDCPSCQTVRSAVDGLFRELL